MPAAGCGQTLRLDGARLEAGAAAHGQSRVAREGGIDAGAGAEREARAAGVADDPLVPAAIAKAGVRAPGCHGLSLEAADTSLCIVESCGPSGGCSASCARTGASSGSRCSSPGWRWV